MTDIYDGSIQSLLETCEDDWGDPDINRENLIPLGLGPIDEAIWGLDQKNGDLVLIIGPEKARKSTLLYNMIINYMMADKPTEKPITVIDTLEPGVPPKKVRDYLLSNVATRYLMECGHRTRVCQVCKTPTCKQLVLCPEHLLYMKRTDEQAAAIEAAKMTLNKWPLRIFGPAWGEGRVRDLTYSKKRWKHLIKKHNTKIIAVDHLQQYSFTDTDNDHEKQIRSFSAVSDLVAEHKIIFLLVSQVSLTSEREARQGLGELIAKGGKKGAQDANVQLEVKYKPGQGYFQVKITRSRRSGGLPTVTIPLEENSGAISGKPFLEGK